ncbi:MAG TPA: response regulator [Chitinophagaceae bacterium]|jgi:CheY-like chemotaxis protein|nr:response regulator [Chitinophagaceae bacterium]
MLNYKLLVVDDDEDDREIMNEAFSMQGFKQHLILSSPEEVITYLQKVKDNHDLPQLIIMDLNMHGISGCELMQAIKGMDRYKDIDVYIYSSTDNIYYKKLCLDLGAKEFIPKPNKIQGYIQLAERIRGLLNKD